MPKKTARCSCCGHRCRGRYDQRTVRVRDLGAADWRLYLEFQRWRVWCPRCRNVFVEQLDWLATNPRYTQRFTLHVGFFRNGRYVPWCRTKTSRASVGGRPRRRYAASALPMADVKGKHQRSRRLRAPDSDDAATPIDIVHAEINDFSRAQAIHGEEQEDRVIATTYR